MLTKNPKIATDDLARLIQFATENDALTNGETLHFSILADAVLSAAEKGNAADDRTLLELTLLVQDHITLPVYTLRQAAAWLGLSYEALRDAHYNGRIQTLKPGHDLLVSAEEVRRYNDERRYPLRRMKAPVDRM